MTKDPLEFWRDEIGSMAPIGMSLRRGLSSRWVRFHSLPKGKRYADSEPEYQEILHRHTTVTDLLFAPGERIHVFRARLFEERNEPRTVAGRPLSDASIELPANPGTVSLEDDDHYVVRSLTVIWKPSFFDALTREIADDQECEVVFVSPASHDIYAPYDGGMDVFPASHRTSSSIARLAAWRSKRADGL